MELLSSHHDEMELEKYGDECVVFGCMCLYMCVNMLIYSVACSC